jgi:hypothetical protein
LLKLSGGIAVSHRVPFAGFTFGSNEMEKKLKGILATVLWKGRRFVGMQGQAGIHRTTLTRRLVLGMRGKEGDGQKEGFLAMGFGAQRFHGVILVFLRNVFAIVPKTTTMMSSGGNASS